MVESYGSSTDQPDHPSPSAAGSSSTVVVQEPTIEGPTIRCGVTAAGRVRRFLTGEPFRAEYDADLSDVPPAIASVPVLAHVCPVAWATGADVSVPCVDAAFHDSLREVRQVLCGMYDFMEGGAVRARRVVDTRERRPAGEFEDAGLLFSGGVDSVTSFVRRREEDPTLISVQGWVIDFDEGDRWETVRGHVSQFADEHHARDRYVRSNMLSVLDTPLLQAHFQRYVDGAWYSSVGHGLGLLGLCAPLSYALGLGTVYVAATHTPEFEEPWGSHPDIDDRVRWAHASGHHDGYELSRQEKIERIVEYVRSENRDLTLRTCTRSERGDNCNECEKCYRTMCGLVLAGVDPGEYGYRMDPGTFEDIRETLAAGGFVMGADERFMWRDLKRHADPEGQFPVRGAGEFFAWLSGTDIDAVAESAAPPVRQTLLQAAARHVPYPAYSVLYPLYDRLKDTLDTG